MDNFVRHKATRSSQTVYLIGIRRGQRIGPLFRFLFRDARLHIDHDL